MKLSKLTPTLASHVQKAGTGEVLDVILELSPLEPGRGAAAQPQSRAEKIATLQDSFSREARPVEELIQSLGGEVTGKAWINQTVRARVPVQEVGRLTELDAVVTLDVPRAIEPE